MDFCFAEEKTSRNEQWHKKIEQNMQIYSNYEQNKWDSKTNKSFDDAYSCGSCIIISLTRFFWVSGNSQQATEYV